MSKAKRLREIAEFSTISNIHAMEFRKAADELDTLTADNRKLRELVVESDLYRYGQGLKCPVCRQYFHTDRCALADALKEGK